VLVSWRVPHLLRVKEDAEAEKDERNGAQQHA
jgi:hypothetical protein